jgi:hypothetical protein
MRSPTEMESNEQQCLFAVPIAPQHAVSREYDGWPVIRNTDTLTPHPILLKLNLRPSTESLLALEKMGDAPFEQPILITRNDTIVDGYARWHLARRRGRATLLCVKLQLTDREALQRILKDQFPRRRLISYWRILLALDLEFWFQQQARANQSSGGKWRGSSKLTEDRRLDCRKEIASAASVSTGNVTKVKSLLRSAMAEEVMSALRATEISIHRAWLLSKLPVREQQIAFERRRFPSRVTQRIRKLLSKNSSMPHPAGKSLRLLIQGFRGVKNALGTDDLCKQISDVISALERKLTTGRSESDVSKNHPEADIGRQSEILGQYTGKALSPQKFPEVDRLPYLRPRF